MKRPLRRERIIPHLSWICICISQMLTDSLPPPTRLGGRVRCSGSFGALLGLEQLAVQSGQRRRRRVVVQVCVRRSDRFGYEMACGHCRRHRKQSLAFNFDQLCWIRGLSSSPKSQGGPKVVLRKLKMAPEFASRNPENSSGRPEAHPGRPIAHPRRRPRCTRSPFSRPAHLPPQFY